MTVIEGKVAKIIDVYTVVINRGRANGVEDGMRFIIYEQGGEITDPDTGELLGRFENIKRKIKVVNVSEKISTAMSDETYQVATPSALNLYSLNSSRSEIKELPLNQETRDGLIEHKKVGIKNGDLVRQILD